MSNLKQAVIHELSLETASFLKSVVGGPVDVLEIKQLKSSTSSLVYNVLFEDAESKQEVVLRMYDNKQWLSAEPDLVRHEAEALDFAYKNNVNSPKLIATDEHGEHFTHPAIVMSKLPGTVILRPQDVNTWLEGLAQNLAQIHIVKPQDFIWKYFAYSDINYTQVPLWSEHKEQWSKLIGFAKLYKPQFKNSFIHRDYHPANILWQDGNLSGTVDWVNACAGPAGIDVGHARVNLVMLKGLSIAEQFLESYIKCRGQNFIYDPYWDVISLLDIGIDDLKTYPGWAAFGVNDLTDKIIRQRVDEYAVALSIKI